MKRISQCLAGLLLGGLVFSAAAQAQNAADFDANGDGQLVGEERRLFLLHRASDLYRKYDKNRNGKLEEAELQKYNDDLAIAITNLDNDLDNVSDRNRGTVAVGAADVWVKEKTAKQPSKTVAGIYIRKNPEDITILTDPKDYSKAESALASYSRDFRTDANLWTVKGTAGVAIPFVDCDAVFAAPRLGSESDAEKKAREARRKECRSERKLTVDGPTYLTSVMLVPSITMDRFKNSKDKSKDVDLLSPRLTSEFEFMGGTPLGFDAHYLRPAVVYATDTRFKSSVLSAELQWEPARADIGIGTAVSILGGLIDYRLRPIIVAQMSHVFDNGAKKTIKNGDSDWRIGPKIGLELWPSNFPSLGFYMNWTYLRGVGHDDKNQTLFEAGATWQLDEEGHFTLEANYRKGEAPLVKDRIEAFLVGFGVKF